jgi:P pilus assembly chaperone PapD
MFHRTLVAGMLACAGLAYTAAAQAGITLGATRVVYEARHKEESIVVRNVGKAPVLTQSWIDAGEGVEAPFIVTPPLSRLDGGRSQRLRLMYEGQGLPDDRESVAWLNVQEVPVASGKENTLQLAVRQRIKVFYRPKGLPGSAAEAPAALQWTVARDSGKGAALHVRNPSAYHVTISRIEAAAPALKIEGEMVAPGGERTFALPAGASVAGPVSIKVSTINDYGGTTVTEATAQPANAE